MKRCCRAAPPWAVAAWLLSGIVLISVVAPSATAPAAAPAAPAPAPAAATPQPADAPLATDAPVWPPQRWQLGLYAVTAVVLTLAAAGAVGAAATLPTLFLAVGGGHVTPATALGLQSCVSFAAGVSQLAYYATQRHPVFRNRALIDPNVAIVLTAPGSAGMLLGGLGQRLVPPWVVLLSLVLTMAATSVTLTSKAHEAWRAQRVVSVVQRAASTVHTSSLDDACRPMRLPRSCSLGTALPGGGRQASLADLKRALAEDGAEVHVQVPVKRWSSLSPRASAPWEVAGSPKLRATSALHSSTVVVLHSDRAELRKLQSFDRWSAAAVLDARNPLKTWRLKHAVLLALVLVALLLPVTTVLVPECGSSLWLLAMLSGLPLLTGVTVFTCLWLRRYILRAQHLPRGGAAPGSIEQVWTLRRLAWVPAASLVSGGLSGFNGAGGFIILARIAIALDIHPQAMAGTLQSSLVGYGASMLCIFGLLGQVPWRTGAVVAALTVIATALGHLCITRAIRRSGAYYLVLVIMAACAVVTTGVAAYNLTATLRVVAAQPALWAAAGNLCSRTA